MKRKKAAMSLLCAVMFMLALPCHALINWNSIISCEPFFFINNGTATWALIIDTNDEESSIMASVYLYKETANGGETLIDSWTLLDGIGRLSESGSCSNLSSGSYHMAFYITVDGTNGEDTTSEHRYKTIP